MTAPNIDKRRAISSETWLQIKIAYTSGIGLREIARNMGIPEGTVTSGSVHCLATAVADEFWAASAQTMM